jgi:hypothetical protein
MKTLFTSISILFSTLILAQAPEGINYQAVVRDASGNALLSQDVGIKISLIQGSPSGDVVYEESFSLQTSPFGLVNMVIGQGDVINGDFSSIDWSLGPFFVEVAADETGGTFYNTLGTQQLMSVPYALYAKNAGNGSPGPQGDQGFSAYDIWLSLGNTGTEADFIASLTGPQGPAGTNGVDGTNGLDGNDGADGANGTDGASAYDTWLSLGNTGTEADFIASLTGPSGPTGANGLDGTNGADGASAYDTWLSLGNTGTEADFIASLTGPQGPSGTNGVDGTNGIDGTNGADGASAYDTWLSLGNTGTEADFIASLTGPQGPAGTNGLDGTNGADGANGVDGASAYDTWLSLGNTGTEADFIASLTGPQGPAGANGVDGTNGLDGTNGTDGTNGLDGESAYDTWLSLGNTGTEADFIASLTGPPGADGADNAWSLTGNSGTNPTSNFMGTTDAQDLVLRTNNIENFRINTSGNIDIGAAFDDARIYARILNTDATTNNGLYVYHDGAASGATYGTRTMNYSSTSDTKYGIYNYTNNEGTGTRYGLWNMTYMNSASNNTGYGAYNYLSSYGTGNHRASYNYLNHYGTGVSTQNYASYNLINISTSTNTSTLYGEYTEVDFSAGTRYGEYKEMNSNSSYTITMYGDYNHMLGTGNGVSYAIYNDFDNTGTGHKYGIRNEFADVDGNKYGVYNFFASGTATGTIYGTINGVFNEGTSNKYGTYNIIEGGDGIMWGSYTTISPAITNSSNIYGVFSGVNDYGTGTHYGIYSSAAGANNYAAYFEAGNVVMNGAGGDYDVRIESDTKENMVLVDASADILRVGNDLTGDSENGTVVNGTVVEYVADFDNGNVEGTAIGIGSVEFLLDGSSLTMINNNFAPSTYGNRSLGTSALRWSAVYAVNGTIQTSDARKKKNIHNLNYGLNELMALRPVSYQWRSDSMGITPIAPNQKETKLGFVAQEVQSILPEIVKDKEWLPVSEDRPEEYHLVPMQTLGMSYTEMTPVIVKAIQEQQEIINAQNQRIEELEKRIEQILNKK